MKAVVRPSTVSRSLIVGSKTCHFGGLTVTGVVLAGMVLACMIALGSIASPSFAGPNAGGTIIVHDPELAYTTGLPSFCGLGTGPSSCEAADTEIDGADAAHPKVWKMYAAFATPPRLKGLAFGIHYDPSIHIVAYGECTGDLNNGGPGFPGPGWPGSDTGNAIIFQFTQTSTLVEAFWFAGYNAASPIGQIFCLRDNPDPALGGQFGDDSVPPQLDPIAGYGCLGFDTPGNPVCPSGGAPGGACCYPDGHCIYGPLDNCPTGDWRANVPCTPNPCPQPPSGACCYPDGTCRYVTLAECHTGDWRENIPCSPNPCPQPPQGACCYPDGTCRYVTQANCPTGDWRLNVPCDPDPCSPPPPPEGACCYPDGTCRYVLQADCPTGYWIPRVPCDPNPCGVYTPPCSAGALLNRGAPPWNAGSNRSDRSGPNLGGTIFVHDASLAYTTDQSSYCGMGSAPTSCQGADVDLSGSDAEHPAVWKVYAAFASGSQPRLKGMSWGIQYSPSDVKVIAWCNCCGDMNNGAAEFAGPGWPGTDTGDAIVFQYTRTTPLVECYWFAGYNYSGRPSCFQLRDNPDPNLGGYFGDDSMPPRLDPIAGYGAMGFDQPCQTSCPRPPTSSCCIGGACYVLTAEQCANLHGTYLGDKLPCDPNPCEGVPAEETTWGRIKNLYRE